MQGQSNKKISELTASSCNTVKKYIHKFIHEHLTYDAYSAMSDHELDLLFGYTEPAVRDKRFEQLQSLLPDMEKQMKRKGMIITLIWEQYRVTYPAGYAITQFYKYYRHFTKRTQPVMHIEHKAGDKMYIDFTGEKLSITDKDSGSVASGKIEQGITGKYFA